MIKRRIFQTLFFVFSLSSGILLFLHMRHLAAGAPPAGRRLPFVEAFLPVSALLGLKRLVLTGEWDAVHPAALAIIMMALLSALFFGRIMCSWLCPVGFFSEMCAKTRDRPRKSLPGFVSIPLHIVRYMLLVFFIAISFFVLDAREILQFQNSPYNKIAEYKMLVFFTDPAAATAIAVLALVVAGFFISNFWCRFLCPYGALLGLIGKPFAASIRRDESKCIKCLRCRAVCPNGLEPDTRSRTTSEACTRCLSCESVCPPGALSFSRFGRSGALAIAIAILMIFIGGRFVASFAGNWRSSVTDRERSRILPYMQLIKHH